MNASELADRLSNVIYPVMILAGMAWGATGEVAIGLVVLVVLVLGGVRAAHPSNSRIKTPMDHAG